MSDESNQRWKKLCELLDDGRANVNEPGGDSFEGYWNEYLDVNWWSDGEGDDLTTSFVVIITEGKYKGETYTPNELLDNYHDDHDVPLKDLLKEYPNIGHHVDEIVTEFSKAGLY